MKRMLMILGIVLLGFAMSPTSALAQATAQISGTVADTTGALLPGVDVTATQTGTGISRSTVTNETGSYVLPNLTTDPTVSRRHCRDSRPMCRPKSCCKSTAIPSSI